MPVEVVCDLRPLFGPVRDQGLRPTCLAFAASDAHTALRPGWEPLSCEYAYYHAVRRCKGDPHVGSTVEGMVATLRDDGQPHEAAWPYLAVLPANLADWHPPARVGPLFRRAGRRSRLCVENILQCFGRGIPVVIAMTLSGAFYLPDGEGVIAADEPVDPTRRHAVAGVGWGMHGGDRLVLARNSWGTGWGVEGHAWISERYLEPRLLEAIELTEDLTHVSGRRPS
jgi:hypothetical protein